MRGATAVNTDMQTGGREGVIRAHIGLARNIALRLAGRVPASVDLDDLIGAGVLGLIDAVDRFDASRSIPFEAYARTRIQGAILDAMRAEDHLSRRERRRNREADRAEAQLRMKLGRELNVEEAHRARRGVPRALAHAQTFVRIEDADDASLDAEESAFARLAAAQEHERVRDLIKDLPQRDQTILSLYYEEELTYREIGQVMGVTESRICQILRGIHQNLRKGLEEAD
ncbi:MAG TPA: sigma-70 family RNA polymerase sigma factor [Myxococcales bacterium]|jgi:RNA polymerase sigma factor for flagellar operon FliA|nr:sigma-70 family RNA polymerase sigma factor [Myxococcales bacterium]